ncbi:MULTISPECIES: hypothetical protein [Pseudomonas]|uniref:phosphoribosyltransferase-like protein n=1 Tax=Pseudomonas TaxID=286 RepID=UPI001070BBB9|nr:MULTISPECIES: hypothetical protein [Pseudomonas]QBR29270.1 hypothetical protein E3Z29_01305 [Pseudomonas sp. S150]UZT92760.1 hypothetical protein OPS05_27370 [Pseudomonas koreensis]
MSFHVPEKYSTLFGEVQQRFRMLLKKRIVTGIDEDTLDCWLANFKTEEEHYFAACVLGRLIFRSKSMIDSSIDQLLHCMLPTYLRQKDLYPYDDIDSFLSSIRQDDPAHFIRFVGVDGSKQNDTGKSGVVVIRHYKRRAKIPKSVTVRPDALSQLPEHVKCVVFLDDMLGTGKQFETFAKTHALASKSDLHIVYCPLVAFQDGLDTLAKRCPWLTVLPIETLNAQHQFFCDSAQAPGVWAVDGTNTVADARAFYDHLATKRGIPKSTRHGLDLLLGFEDSTPNNSLSVLWASSEDWNNLLTR